MASTVIDQPAPALVPRDTLAAIAEGLARSFARSDIARAGDEGRRYVRLLQTPAYEAWLTAWSPAADLDLHDHGGSQGAFHVVGGHLLESYSDLERPRPLQTHRLGAGQTSRLTATTVHRVWNPGPAEALSVHVYSPPLTSMTFFDDSPDRFLAPLRTERVQGSPEAGVPA